MYNQGTIADMMREAQRMARVEQNRADHLWRLLQNAESSLVILKAENESLKKQLESLQKAEKKAKNSDAQK